MEMSKFTLQKPVTPIMYGITSLHDHILFFLVIILFVVMFIFISTLYQFCYMGKDTLTVIQDDYQFLFELPNS